MSDSVFSIGGCRGVRVVERDIPVCREAACTGKSNDIADRQNRPIPCSGFGIGHVVADGGIDNHTPACIHGDHGGRGGFTRCHGQGV